MKAKSKNPSEDLPNQEKNQYWTVYWWETGPLYTKGEKGSNQKDLIKKIADLLQEGKLKWQEWKQDSWYEWLTWLGRKDKLMAACLKRLWTCYKWKISLSVYYDVKVDLFESAFVLKTSKIDHLFKINRSVFPSPLLLKKIWSVITDLLYPKGLYNIMTNP